MAIPDPLEMRSLEAIEAGSGVLPPLSCTGTELGAICRELRRLRRALRRVIELSGCGRSVRLSWKALRHDPCGVDDPGNALAADGYPIRDLGDLESMVAAAGDRLAGCTPREMAVLISETRRHRRALHALSKTARDCTRTRAYSLRLLAVSPWAGAQDSETYPATTR